MYDKAKFKRQWAGLFEPVFGWFRGVGIKPMHITLAGSVLILSGCLLLLNNQPILAFVGFSLGGLCDAIDGAYARAIQQTTKFGGFCDSVIDRYNEFILVGSVLFLYRDNELLYYFSFIFFLGIGLMSYSRALFEKNDFSCPQNPFEYLERGLLFLVFLMVGRLDLWLIVIAIGTHSFIIHRVYRFHVLADVEHAPGK